MNPHQAIIEVKGLQLHYSNCAAVNGIDFSVYPGEIFGLIGTNGAGKTSTMKALAGVEMVTSGTIEVMGKPPAQMRLSLGYLTQQFSLYSDLSIAENLSYYARVRRLPEKVFQARRQQYLQWLGLTPYVNRLTGQLSGGMKQKLALCCTLITHPTILLLDEVSTGIDAVFRREIWSFLAKIAHQGTTIVVATHYLDEAERCDRVALIHQGTIVQMGSPSELRTQFPLRCFEIILNESNVTIAEKALQSAIANEHPCLVDIKIMGNSLLVFLSKETPSPEQIIQQLLQDDQLSIFRMKPVSPTLESVIAHYLKKTAIASNELLQLTTNLSVQLVTEVSKTEQNFLLKVDQVSKAYGQFQALFPLSFTINRGDICGLLGANGAGKTTLMKLLCGLLPPSNGKIHFTSNRLSPLSSSVKQRLGYMSQKFTLYPDLTVQENLTFFGWAYRVPRQKRNTRIAWAVETLGLQQYRHQRVGTLSGGNKQRVAFAAAILHQPDILFLDEPTTGMDILVRRQFWQLLQTFARQGTAIVVTTHSLEEAEYCTKLLLMRSGELILQGSPTTIKMQQSGMLIEILSAFPKQTLYKLEQTFDPWRLIFMGDRVQMILDESFPLSQVKDYLDAAGTTSHHISPIPFSLEAAFLNISQSPQQKLQNGSRLGAMY